MAETKHVVAVRSRRWRSDKADLGTAAAILKHVEYKDVGACVHVRKTARVRLRDGRRVFATQAYWELVFGLSARRIDAHMRRTCDGRSGVVCMNPVHIVSMHTDETACALIARLWEEQHGVAGTAPCKKVVEDDQDRMWRNHAEATEELVIAEEDLPTSMEQELPGWRVMDYFSLLPQVQCAVDVVQDGAVTS